MKAKSALILFSILAGTLYSNDAFGQKKQENSAVVFGTVRIERSMDANGKITSPERKVEGAVVSFHGEKYSELAAKTDAKGKYMINLPFGKYSVCHR